MKKRALLMLVVVLLLLIPSTVFAFGSVDGKFPAHFALTFCWDGWPCGQTGLHIYKDGTFNTDDGAVGFWTFVRETGYGALDITVGCLPLYEGFKGEGWHFDGEMNCRDGSGGHGTWFADRMATGFVPVPAGITSSGR
jgi:hypothetical protein